MELEGDYVDKTKSVVNDQEMALRDFSSLFGEFNIAKELKHKNIVDYKYFVRKHQQEVDSCHLITQFLPEGDMNEFLKLNGP